MSAILRLTQETMVLDKGQLLMRAPTQTAVDYYLSSGFSRQGERLWEAEEVPPSAAPFRPIALRVKDSRGRVVETVRSTEPFQVEFEYQLAQPLTGLRVGLYFVSPRGEPIFTSFDTDESAQYEQHSARKAGHYFSRCSVPANLFNEGRLVLGVNASSFKIKRYFQDEQALVFSVDGTGAPGSQWAEPRQGPIRPALDWKIEVAR
jgi:lipopolysaccharide transport system ATP-binding protein